MHQIRFGVGLSMRTACADAARHACEQALESLAQAKHASAGSPGAGYRPDLAMVFFTSPHVTHTASLASVVQRVLGARHWVGVSGESVCAGAIEAERVPAIVVVAASLPGVEITPFDTGTIQRVREEVGGSDQSAPEAAEALSAALGLNAGARVMLTMADPFSVPVSGTLARLNRAARVRVEQMPNLGPVPIVGGLASASKSAGGNRLILDDRHFNTGLVGVTLGGALRVDTILSQGCRAFGPTFLITSAKNNMILGLGGRPAWEVLRELVESLSDEDRPHLERGLFIGRVVNEYKERFGRDDYLIRAIVGVNEESRGIAVGDLVRVGQTVRFHLRDARTASDDLAMLLDGQKILEPPAGALLFTCNGRGTRLFENPNHDSSAIVRAFDAGAPEDSGPAQAKSGEAYDPGRCVFPLGGLFSAGEIGPLSGHADGGTTSYLHGHAASLAIFRQPPTPVSDSPAGLGTRAGIATPAKVLKKREPKAG
jgi:small ligand-binding sensory domain FIST